MTASQAERDTQANVSHETYRHISECAQALLLALEALNPTTGQLPSYGNPHPEGWGSTWNVARPYSDQTIANAYHYASCVLLEEGFEEELERRQEELDRANY